MEKNTEKVNKLERIGKIFIKPKEAFESIKKEPDIWLVLGIISLVTLVCLMITKEYYKVGTMENIVNNPQFKDIEITDDFINAATTSTIIIALISSILMPIIKGFFSHWIALLFGGEGTLKESISATVYAYFIAVFGFCITSAMMTVTDDFFVSISPAAFIDTADNSKMILYNILRMFEVFNIWYLIVAGIGYSIVHKIRMNKALIITFIPMLLLLMIQLTAI